MRQSLFVLRARVNAWRKVKLALVCLLSGAALGAACGAATFTPYGWFVGAMYGGLAALCLAPFALASSSEQPLKRAAMTAAALLPIGCAASKLLILGAIPLVALLAVVLYTSSRSRVLANWSIGLGLLACGAVFVLPAWVPSRSQTQAELIRDLGADEMDVSFSAMHRLMEQGLEGLKPALAQKDEATRSNAAHGIALLDDPVARQFLATLADDPNPHVRMWVAYGLGRGDTPGADALLARLGKDPEAFVRGKAFEAKMARKEWLGQVTKDRCTRRTRRP